MSRALLRDILQAIVVFTVAAVLYVHGYIVWACLLLLLLI